MEIIAIVAIVIVVGLFWSMRNNSQRAVAIQAAHLQMRVEEKRQEMAKEKAARDQQKAARDQQIKEIVAQRLAECRAIYSSIAWMDREEYEASPFYNDMCNPEVFTDELTTPVEDPDWGTPKPFYAANPKFHAFMLVHVVDFMQEKGLSQYTVEIGAEGREPRKLLAVVADEDELRAFTEANVWGNETVLDAECLDEWSEGGWRRVAKPIHTGSTSNNRSAK